MIIVFSIRFYVQMTDLTASIIMLQVSDRYFVYFYYIKK